LGKQLDLIAQNELIGHRWSMQYSAPKKDQSAAIYYPFITRKNCINCHISSVREMQDGVVFASTLKELMASRIDGSLAIPKEPSLHEILGVFVIRFKVLPRH